MAATNLLLGAELTAIKVALTSIITPLETFAATAQTTGTSSLSGLTTSITSALMVILSATAAVVVRI